MIFQRFLVGLVDCCRRNALLVALAGAVLAAAAGTYAATRLGITTETDKMFAESLPWRQRELAFEAEFPQFTNLLVVVIDAKAPEQADATAAALAEALSADKAHFTAVRRPDALPFLRKEGLLFLDTKQLEALLERMIDAQPFLGQLAKDPSARGLFGALGLLGKGVEEGQVDLGPYQAALAGFHQAMADALAGRPQPLSWQRLLGGELADLGGKYKFVLAQAKLDHSRLEPGSAATQAIREAAAPLEFVKSGDARVRITGNVALADEEFGTVAKGAVAGLIGSIALISLWLFLAVRSWRLIVPILLTLGLGLMLTLWFAAAAVGTLNLVSVGFGILFVGIAVDFAIQFCVRYREMRRLFADPAAAMSETGRRVGGQILVAAAATAAGFLAFVPTNFQGVAELGLIAGAGMLIAFVCTVTFLPAMVSLLRPHGERAEVGLRWAAPLDAVMVRRRRPMLIVFAGLAGLGVVLLPRLSFDADPLHTKDPGTEAMRTLYDLMDSQLTNPFTIDVLAPNATAATGLAERLRPLPLVSEVVSIDSFVPKDQEAKLAQIADAAMILGPTLAPHGPVAAANAAEIRAAAKTALDQITPALVKRPADRMLAAIADDLRRLAGAPDATVLAADRSLTRFLPTELDELRRRARSGARDLAVGSGRIGSRLGLAGRASEGAGAAKAAGAQQQGARRVRRRGDGGRPGRRRPGGDDRGDQPHHRRCVPRGGDFGARRDHRDPVRGAEASARRVAGPGAAAAVRADDRGRGRPAGVAAQLRQHHRAAPAAGCRRVVQHLFCDELAGGPNGRSRLGHGQGNPVLCADHRDGVRLARAVGASRHREHGRAVADQPRLHALREPRFHPGSAGGDPRPDGRATLHRPEAAVAELIAGRG